MFGSKKTKGFTLNQDAHCSKCNKRIKPNTKYSVINGKLYCEQCYRKKKDMDFLTFALLMDDD